MAVVIAEENIERPCDSNVAAEATSSDFIQR